MSSNAYYIGDEVALTATITSANEANDVAITVRSPDGSVSTPSVAISAVDQGGLWVSTATAQVTLSMAGEWRWKAVSTGAVIAANPSGAFMVQVNPF